VVFVKAPRPGATKTRLVPVLGAEGAAALSRAMAEAALAATTPGPGEYERLVFFDPPDAAGELRSWLPGLRLIPQAGADLGERMQNALAHALGRGADRAAVIGTDTPRVDRERVNEALTALDTADLVLGPAEDGGYYLLALSRTWPELFTGVSWSTPEVRTETLERAAALGLRVHQLPFLRDVDTADDLRAEWPGLRPRLVSNPDLVRAIDFALARGVG